MKLSLVIPVYNEEASLPELFQSIMDALEPRYDPWEVVFVDDGSTDGSLQILRGLAAQEPDHVRVIVFRRNFGQTAAIAGGLDNSRGEIIVLLDADMQNDPADIPLLLSKLDEGYDVVSGWRKSRKDNTFTRTVPSVMANALISAVTGVHLHDYGCTLKAYRRSALEGFRLYGEMHRFIPVFASSIGARITEIPVHHHPRRFGKTKYGLDRTVKVVLDLMTAKFLLSYSNKPMRLIFPPISCLTSSQMITKFREGFILSAILLLPMRVVRENSFAAPIIYHTPPKSIRGALRLWLFPGVSYVFFFRRRGTKNMTAAVSTIAAPGATLY